MPLYTKYKKYVRMISNDNGTTWTEEVPGVYRIGDAIEHNSPDCGFLREYNVSEFGEPILLETLNKIKEITVSGREDASGNGFLSSFNMSIDGGIIVDRYPSHPIYITTDLVQKELLNIQSINTIPLYDIKGYVIDNGYFYWADFENVGTGAEYIIPKVHKYNLATLTEEIVHEIEKPDDTYYNNTPSVRKGIKNLTINNEGKLELRIENELIILSTSDLSEENERPLPSMEYDVTVTHYKNMFLSYHRYNSGSIYFKDEKGRTIVEFNGNYITGGLGVSNGCFIFENRSNNLFLTDFTFFKCITLNDNEHCVWADANYIIIRSDIKSGQIYKFIKYQYNANI